MDSVNIIEFYDNFKFKYKEYLNPAIVSISMTQAEDWLFLQTVEVVIVKTSFEKQIIKKIDLAYKEHGIDQETNETGDCFFYLNDPIEDNVEKFIKEFSPFSIANTTDLFHADACEKINRKYNTFGIDGLYQSKINEKTTDIFR